MSKQFDRGLGVSNVDPGYKATVKADTDVLKAAHARDEKTADVVRKAEQIQSTAQQTMVRDVFPSSHPLLPGCVRSVAIAAHSCRWISAPTGIQKPATAHVLDTAQLFFLQHRVDTMSCCCSLVILVSHVCVVLPATSASNKKTRHALCAAGG